MVSQEGARPAEAVPLAAGKWGAEARRLPRETASIRVQQGKDVGSGPLVGPHKRQAHQARRTAARAGGQVRRKQEFQDKMHRWGRGAAL